MKPKKGKKQPQPQSFSMRLRAKRKELGYTQKEMAALLGASVNTYEAWEQDYRGTNIFAQAHILEEMGRLRAKKKGHKGSCSKCGSSRRKGETLCDTCIERAITKKK